MRFSAAATVASLTAIAAAQRPTNTSICDYYTTALLKNNTAANQYTLLTLVVNTAVIGNYTTPNVGVTVPGILAKGTYNGTAVNLLTYFDGTLLSTNTGGNNGTSVNFLDDGGAAPLMKNMPCNSGVNGTAKQCLLLTHLYEYFGGLLGCSMMGQSGFPSYAGDTSMYKVHKFMDLNPFQVGYFNQQVGLAAASFGVASSDVQAVGMALDKTFNRRCAAPVAIPSSAQPMLQSICITSNCILAANATCSAYDAAVVPAFANGTVIAAPGNNISVTNGTSGSSGSGSSGSGSGSGSSGSGSKSGAMAIVAPGFGILAMIAGAIAML